MFTCVFHMQWIFTHKKVVVSYIVIFGGTTEKGGPREDEIRVINFCKLTNVMYVPCYLYELQYFISFLREHIWI